MNPNAPSMKETNGADSNSGMDNKSAPNGQTLVRAYGRDNSDLAGSAKAEKGDKIGGGVDNLSHSLKGTSIA